MCTRRQTPEIADSQETTRTLPKKIGSPVLRCRAPRMLLLFSCLILMLVGCIFSEEQRALRKLQTDGIATTTASVFAAIESRNSELLDLLMKVSVSIDGQNEEGQTPLIAAICSDNQDATSHLLALTTKEQLAFADKRGFSALSYAVEKKQHALIGDLISRGAPASVVTPSGGTAIASAVRNGYLPIVQLLVGEDADPHLQPYELQEPLYSAVESGNQDIAELLLKAGADPNYISTADGRSPLASAVESDDLKLAKLLAENGAAMLCVLPAAAAVVGRTSDGKILEPPLMSVAFDHENLDMIRLLLDLKAPLDHPGKDGTTPLRRALDKKNVSLVQLLLSHGADPGDTLFLALQQADSAVIDLLLAHGASLNRKDANGDTPLHIAVERGDVALVEQLLESEPDLSTTGRHGQTVFALATAAQNLPLMERFLKRGADPNAPFAHEDLQDSFKAMIPSDKFLYYLKRDLGLAPIMLAAAYGNVDMVNMLIENGARRYKTSKKYSRWPINFACDGEHIKCAQILLGRSPDSKRDVRVVISLSEQNATLYKDGEAVLSTGVSTGMRGFHTPSGKFVITNKALNHTSSIYGSSMPYFQRLSCQAFGFHAGSCPGYPASHGCIRMPHSRAKAFYDATKVGDPVEILH